MEFRLNQLHDAVAADPKGRVAEVRELLDKFESRAEEMTLAERLGREGKLPKRICHCDTKVNNMLVDAETNEVLCVIDLDTTMYSYVFSDYGDFLRTGACTTAEDEPDTSKIGFNVENYKAFTEGYLSTAGEFLTDIERDNLPYAVRLFPYMQGVRFLADYINGDTYFKIKYADHNLVRAKAQWAMLMAVDDYFAKN
jgi:Ser/Thr protein kinase RdoA (MazF antagonist)